MSETITNDRNEELNAFEEFTPEELSFLDTCIGIALREFPLHLRESLKIKIYLIYDIVLRIRLLRII